jgi:3-deoxy-manno-octulosonate cytidylyltransferase (CMP-KDO synthetase)
VSQKILAVIPARYASSRFPGKPLVEINGISMIRRVYEQVVQVQAVDQVVVATDDQRIFEHVANFGGHVAMTNADHPSGTDRCAEVALQVPDATYIINVQGDEPFIQPEQIDLLYCNFGKTDHRYCATNKRKYRKSSIVAPPGSHLF